MAPRGERSVPPRGSPARGSSAGEGPRAQLAEVQRARIVAGATEAVAELGYGGLTVAEVISRARISRRTFYELFEDREECFLAAFDAALACVAEPVLAAHRGDGAWRERVGAALAAALALFDAQPALGRLLVVDALAAGPRALRRRAVVIDALVRAVDEGRATGRGRDPGPLAAEAVVGAVLAVLHARMLEAGRRKPLLELAGPLMSTIMLPYLGAAAAARELERPVPRAVRTRSAGRNGRASPHANPLHGLNMRLTYRTLRVLGAVAEQGERGSLPSNREVAASAEIADQGQMSKLLGRLQSLGLIENRGRGRPHGEPNAWRLTARGAEVVESTRGRPAIG
jgi:AcrR family transcriptional regulator